jgi:TonB family protein
MHWFEKHFTYCPSSSPTIYLLRLIRTPVDNGNKIGYSSNRKKRDSFVKSGVLSEGSRKRKGSCKVAYNFRDYGAFELKRSYQKNLSFGVIGSGLIHTIAIFCLLLISSICTEPEPEKVIRIRTIAQLILPPPPSISEHVTQREQVSEGTFLPVPTAPDRKNSIRKGYHGEIYGVVYDISAQGAGAGSESLGYVEIGAPPKHLLSTIKFVETDRLPECIRSVLPVYPESARKNRIKGEVWLQVLVDENGKVREVNVHKNSGTKVGFEEAAVDAAWQWEYRPAISKNKPVTVWIIYVLKFKLEKHCFSQSSK